jgi:hemerythrin superfamily protein
VGQRATARSNEFVISVETDRPRRWKKKQKKQKKSEQKPEEAPRNIRARFHPSSAVRRAVASHLQSSARGETSGKERASHVPMDALTLLKADHKSVEALFKRFEKLGNSSQNGNKKKLVQQIVKELSIHAAIEEQIFYPAIRKLIRSTEDAMLEALEEHHLVKWSLSELDGMSPTAERYDAKVAVLMHVVRQHVHEEEMELFPKVRKSLEKRQLDALGAALAAAKKTAPTHPHPRAPDTPPANLALGAGARIVDRVRDVGKGFMQRVSGARGKRVLRANGKRANGRAHPSHG